MFGVFVYSGSYLNTKNTAKFKYLILNRLTDMFGVYSGSFYVHHREVFSGVYDVFGFAHCRFITLPQIPMVHPCSMRNPMQRYVHAVGLLRVMQSWFVLCDMGDDSPLKKGPFAVDFEYD